MVMYYPLLIPICFSRHLYALRQVFEQAKTAPGCVFSMSKEMDFSKIKQSKYFQALQPSNGRVINELVTDIPCKTLFIYFHRTFKISLSDYSRDNVLSAQLLIILYLLRISWRGQIS